MKTWISPKAQKGLKSKISGKGIFAISDVAMDEIVIIKAGSFLTQKEVKSLPFNEMHAELQISDNLFVCPKDESEYEDSMSYINHSCNPNVGMRGDIVCVAMREIKEGEELTIDYGMVCNQDYQMNCMCGTDNCRKVITGQDYKLPEVQKHGKYLSAYVKSIIGKSC